MFGLIGGFLGGLLGGVLKGGLGSLVEGVFGKDNPFSQFFNAKKTNRRCFKQRYKLAFKHYRRQKINYYQKLIRFNYGFVCKNLAVNLWLNKNCNIEK
jgi:predicted lipid-binding transport protein (Tim44 family)